MMENPFNNEVDKEKRIFFQSITDQVYLWMAKNYPGYDHTFGNKLKEISEFHKEIKKIMKKETKEIAENAVLDINKFLSKEYPDLDRKIQDKFNSLVKHSDKQDKILEEIIIKFSKIKDFSCLYEDMYKIREEIKSLRSFVESYKESMKKCFRIMEK